MQWPFKSVQKVIPEPPHPGSFGAIRKYDIHTGVDIYAEEKTPVYLIEPGIVVGTGQFTGEKVGSPWWKDTFYVLMESEKRVLLYGELDKKTNKEISKCMGCQLEDICIGLVEPVLNKKGHLYYSMLHLEEYELGYRGDGVIWHLGMEKPKELKDPTRWLKEI